MQTPGYRNKAADCVTESAHHPKPLPLLAAITFKSSRNFVCFYRCIYATCALVLLIAFYPYLLEKAFLLMLLIALCWGLWRSYLYSLAQAPSGSLGFSGERWEYKPEGSNSATSSQLAGAVLCWPWLIILPLRDSDGGRIHYLIIFRDTLNPADNARLRCWLHACLIPKG